MFLGFEVLKMGSMKCYLLGYSAVQAGKIQQTQLAAWFMLVFFLLPKPSTLKMEVIYSS
jgi:hypothetical protein